MHIQRYSHGNWTDGATADMVALKRLNASCDRIALRAENHPVIAVKDKRVVLAARFARRTYG
jgi:hypothetical protein